jgi:2-polyprenyl-3-methyl-5-hydroxy-6-metoxy-1,4-benzoquinol methylase
MKNNTILVDSISNSLEEHYRSTFSKYGACAQGVDWGSDKEWASVLRQDMMLDVVKEGDLTDDISILDVGCGYGALLDRINEKSLNYSYVGIDLVEELINEAKHRHNGVEFILENIMNLNHGKKYDYVVCNGIMTQKLKASNIDMDKFSNLLIKKMWSLCNVGIAFNVMSTHVNHQVENLYYRNSIELLGWCTSELTSKFKIDASYKLWYEYTVYLYR